MVQHGNRAKGKNRIANKKENTRGLMATGLPSSVGSRKPYVFKLLRKRALTTKQVRAQKRKPIKFFGEVFYATFYNNWGGAYTLSYWAIVSGYSDRNASDFLDSTSNSTATYPDTANYNVAGHTLVKPGVSAPGTELGLYRLNGSSNTTLLELKGRPDIEKILTATNKAVVVEIEEIKSSGTDKGNIDSAVAKKTEYIKIAGNSGSLPDRFRDSTGSSIKSPIFNLTGSNGTTTVPTNMSSSGGHKTFKLVFREL